MNRPGSDFSVPIRLQVDDLYPKRLEATWAKNNRLSTSSRLMTLLFIFVYYDSVVVLRVALGLVKLLDRIFTSESHQKCVTFCDDTTLWSNSIELREPT